MGIAAVSIMLCHAASHVALGALSPVLALAQFGNALFFLLSGYGLFFSLHKLTFTPSLWGVLLWYKKRLLRIFIPYLIWCIPFFVYQCMVYPDTDWLNLLYVFSLLSYWDGSGGVAWFLSVLIALYLISPLIYMALLSRGNVIVKTAIIAIIACALYYLHPSNVTLRLICSNMPNLLAFTLGMTLGYYTAFNKTVKVWWLVVCGSMAIALFFIRHHAAHMLHFGTCMIVLPLLVWLLNSTRRVHTSLRWVGKISLESYLTNGALPRIVALIPWGAADWLNKGNYFGYSIVIVAGLFLAWVMHIMAEPIIKKL